MRTTMKNNSAGKIIDHLLNVLILCLVSAFFFPIYFRTEFAFSDEIFSATGFVNISFFGAIISMIIHSILTYQAHRDDRALLMARGIFVTTFPALAVTFLLRVFGILRDPWLYALLVDRIIVWFSMIFVSIGAVVFIRYRRKYPPKGSVRSVPWVTLKDRKFIDLILLIFFFTLGLYLRWRNIGAYPPHVDEFPHLRHPILFLQGTPIEYKRALLTVTTPIIVVFKFFGVDLAKARMAMALSNMFAIFPLFGFMKKFGRTEAFAAVTLFVLSPIVIAMGQLTRDYAITAVFVYLTLLFTIRILRSEISGQLREWLKNNWINFGMVMALFAYAIYDQASTVSVIIASIMIFASILLLKIIFEYEGSNTLFYILIPLLIIFVIGVILVSNKINFSDVQFAPGYFELLTNGSYQNWTFVFPQIGWFFLAYTLYLVIRNGLSLRSAKAQTELYLSLTFMALMFYAALFLFSGKLDLQTRYYVVFVYYLIPLVALFFARGVKLIIRWFGNYPSVISILIVPFIFGLVVNIPAINFMGSYTEGQNLVSEIRHHNYQQAYSYIKENIETGDVIISDQLQKYDLLYDNIFDGHEYVKLNMLNKNNLPIDQKLMGLEQGWITKTRTGNYDVRGLSFEDVVTEENFIEYIGDLGGDVAIWRFEKLK